MKHKYFTWIKPMILLLVVIIAGIFYSCSPRISTELQVLETKPIVDDFQSYALETQPIEETESTVFYAHICGAVEQPGVYEMEEGSRVYQLIEFAGGYTPDAATDYLNLAEPIRDGGKIIVPTQEELLRDQETGESVSPYGIVASSELPASSQSLKVNLNTATKDQLMTLRGIGEAKAEDIMAYREAKGEFKTIEDIMKISGIKQAAFEKIKETITVN